MNNKTIWVIVLVLSIIATWVLISPSLEVYCGINMPFVTINHEQFTCFGYNVPNDGNKQIGFMLLTAVLMMLPARTMHLAMIKLSQIKKKRVLDEHDNNHPVDNIYDLN